MHCLPLLPWSFGRHTVELSVHAVPLQIVEVDDIMSALVRTGAPMVHNTTKAENVRWHDDKVCSITQNKCSSWV